MPEFHGRFSSLKAKFVGGIDEEEFHICQMPQLYSGFVEIEKEVIEKRTENSLLIEVLYCKQ